MAGMGNPALVLWEMTMAAGFAGVGGNLIKGQQPSPGWWFSQRHPDLNYGPLASSMVGNYQCLAINVKLAKKKW